MKNPTAKFYKDLDILDYHAQKDFLSKSMLSELADCPKRFKVAYIDGYAPPKTKSLEMGSAVHTLALEPEKWKQNFHVLPSHYYDGDGVKKDFRLDKRMEAYQDEMRMAGYEEILSDTGRVEGFKPRSKEAKIVIPHGTHEVVEQMAEAVTKDPAALALLKLPGYVESSIFWEHDHTYIDPKTGEEVTEKIKLRCRPDHLANCGVMPDLKIAESVKPDLFFKSAANFNYHLSVAMSFLGYQAAFGKEADEYPFIAVESKPPYMVEVFASAKPFDEFSGMSYLEYGRKHLDHLLTLYCLCRKKNEWPGYNGGEIGTMQVPDWKVRKMVEKGEY